MNRTAQLPFLPTRETTSRPAPQPSDHAPNTAKQHAPSGLPRAQRGVAKEIADLSTGLASLRASAVAELACLARQGIFSAIPTITREKRRPTGSWYYRAVFPKRSREATPKRRHPIGRADALPQWEAAVQRTRRAHRLLTLIHDIDLHLESTRDTLAALIRHAGRAAPL